MSDADGWAWVYTNARPSKQVLREICFTGFGAPECEELETAAKEVGWLKVVGSVIAKLAYLCTGANPGLKKLERAQQHGVTIPSRDQFLALLENGVLPA